MKKTITLLTSAFLGIFVSNAQITIYSYDVVLAGKVLYHGNDTLKEQIVNGLDPGPAGANKTWNFSTLLPGYIDTMLATNPAWTTSGSSFPSANLAAVYSNGLTAYLINNATGLYMDGAYGDLTGQGAQVVNFNPNEQLTKFPNTYNTSFQNTSIVTITAAYSAQPPIDSIRIKETKTKDVLTDAWGSITTPLGTYNCLREKGKVVTHDSIWAHVPFVGWNFFTETKDSVWHFDWWASGVGLPLLEFDSTEADTIRNIAWLKALPAPGSVNENAVLGGVKAYPNPSSGKVNVSVPATVKEYTAEIYSMTGEKLSSLLAPGKDGSMDFSSLPNGIYFLRITSGKDVITRKIVLNR